jgi:hypothetical protein
MIPVKLCVAAADMDIPPHIKIAVGIYRDGLIRVRIMLLGTCPSR